MSMTGSLHTSLAKPSYRDLGYQLPPNILVSCSRGNRTEPPVRTRNWWLRDEINSFVSS